MFLSQPDSVLLTREFAARRQIGVGDRVELDTPSGRRRFRVRGLLAPEGVARVQGGTLVVMDIAAAETAFTRPGLVNRVDVVVRRDADLERVADALRAVVPAGLAVETPAQRKVDLHKVMQSTRTLLRAVGLLGLLAAFLIAFSRLTTAFEARTIELAVMRAVGVRARRVWWELAKESLLVGAAEARHPERGLAERELDPVPAADVLHVHVGQRDVTPPAQRQPRPRAGLVLRNEHEPAVAMCLGRHLAGCPLQQSFLNHLVIKPLLLRWPARTTLANKHPCQKGARLPAANPSRSRALKQQRETSSPPGRG